jgi:hypothetical protein
LLKKPEDIVPILTLCERTPRGYRLRPANRVVILRGRCIQIVDVLGE